MFQEYDTQQKTAVYALVALSCPVEERGSETSPELPKESWSGRTLSRLAGELEISEEYRDAYPTLVSDRYYPMGSEEGEIRASMTAPFKDMFFEDQSGDHSSQAESPSAENQISHRDGYLLLMQLTVFLLSKNFYDSRARVLLRKIKELGSVKKSDFIAIDNIVGKFVADFNEYMSAHTVKKKTGKKLLRYAKIGAVSLGAGAILAVTGGLAAPAIAAAVVALGGASAGAASVAGFATFTVMGTLFGTAGAGLAGYKMSRRCAELKEFEFEKADDGEAKLAVMIVISGWMVKEDDYKRTFGLLPSAEKMDMEERLTRFYQIHYPERLKLAKKESQKWANSPDDLYDSMKELYGIDPRQESSLRPTFSVPSLSSEKMNLELLGIIRKYLIVSDSSSSSSSTEEGGGSSKGDNLAKKSDKERLEEELCWEEFVRERLSGYAEGQESSKISGKGSHNSGEEGEDGGFSHREPMLSAPSASSSSFRSVSSGDSKAGAGGGEVKKKKAYQFGDYTRKFLFGKKSEKSQVPAAALSSPTIEERGSVREDDKVVLGHLNAFEEDMVQAMRVKSEGSLCRDSPYSADDEDSGAVVDDGDGVAIEGRGSADTKVDSEEAFADNNIFENEYWHWRELEESSSYELYALRWETSLQLELGGSILSLLRSLADAVVQRVLAATVLAALASAIILPYTIIRFTDMIDSTWTLAIERADLAGEELALVLLKRPQGSRPVTLVGHSIGARVIVQALKVLYRMRLEALKREGKTESNARVTIQGTVGYRRNRGDDEEDNGEGKHDEDEDERDVGEVRQWNRETFATSATPSTSSSSSSKIAEGNGEEELYPSSAFDGLIQDVVLLGTPNDIGESKWLKLRSMVTGRLVNGYSEKDMVLALVYRYERWKVRVAGLCPVDVAGVENINLSDIVLRHTDYCSKMKAILEIIDLTSSSSSYVPPIPIPSVEPESSSESI